MKLLKVNLVNGSVNGLGNFEAFSCYEGQTDFLTSERVFDHAWRRFRARNVAAQKSCLVFRNQSR